jgi:hypothetical protein
MNLLWIIFSFAFLQDAVPFKGTEEFEIKMNFEFRQRTVDPNRITLVDAKPAGPLPYLFLNLNLLKANPEEVRVKITTNDERNVLFKKLDPAKLMRLELGYTDDIKDRVSAYQYTAYFLSEDKKPLSRIVILFEEDGTYLVNGIKRGKL